MNRAPDSISPEKQPSVTILAVEDEPFILRLLVKFFSRHGYQVLEAADGEQAIETYRNNKLKIDAVLLDSRLP
jgi:CheY-like chemotaxis protein